MYVDKCYGFLTLEWVVDNVDNRMRYVSLTRVGVATFDKAINSQISI